ncbi:MAG: hypothetical protein ACP6IP_09505 [Candidatus Njordarchaeia archaeon]
MNKKAIIIIFLFLASSFSILNNFDSMKVNQIDKMQTGNMNNNMKLGEYTQNGQENAKVILKPKDKMEYHKNLIYNTLGTQVNSPSYPGLWHDNDYNYRINITVKETYGLDRTNWPLDVYVHFDPWANKNGLKIVDSTGNDVVFQVWNTTGNTTHLSAATITFLVDISANSNETYFLYFDTKSVGKPTFPSQVALGIQTDAVTGETIYTIRGETYTEAVLGPTGTLNSKYVWSGGKIVEIKEASTSANLFTEPQNDIEISRDSNLYNPLGTANSSFKPANRFVVSETQNGPIFILYKVINVPIYDNNNNHIADANLTYRFYSFGWTVESHVKWLMDDTNQNAEYWIGTYMFDQDDGDDVTFNRVRTPNGDVLLGEGLPQTFSGVIKDWGKMDLTDRLRVFITPVLQENVNYTVKLMWDKDVDLDLLIYSENGSLVSGYANLWDKIDANLTSASSSAPNYQDYTEEVSRVARENERWVIIVLGYDDPSGTNVLTNFNITVKSGSSTVATFYGNIDQYIYTSITNAYCNYQDSNFPPTIDTSKEGNVVYWIGGYAKRYFVDDELATYILPMPKEGGDDYFTSLSWNLEYSNIEYYIHSPNGALWYSNTSGVQPPIQDVLYPPSPGNYTLIIHYKDGSYYDANDGSSYDDIDYNLYFEPPYAETEDYAGNSTQWNWLAFYHSYLNRGVGFINISVGGDFSKNSTYTQYLYFGNRGEGPSNDEDYILWSLVLQGTSIKAGEHLDYKYGVLIWDGADVNEFQYYADRMRAPLTVSLGTLERYNISVVYHVLDGDGGPVKSALVKIKNLTSNDVVNQKYTDSSGIVTLDIPRYNNYGLNITLVSGGKTYTIIDSVDYSVYGYTVYSINKYYNFSHLVRLTIKTIDSDNKSLQNAKISLNETVIQVDTNLTGYIDIYLERGILNITIGYKFAYDNYNLTYQNGTFVKDVYGANVSIVKYSLVNITHGENWVLIDLDATAPLPLKLELREGQLSYDVYWGENISVKFVTISENILVDAGNNVTWSILYANNNSIFLDYFNKSATKVSTGTYQVNVSTRVLPAGDSYILRIEANVTGYQIPVPLSIFIKVNPRLTNLETLSLTTNIYWYERFLVQLRCMDALTNTMITEAKVTAVFTGPVDFSQDLTPTNDYYELKIDHFLHTTGSYLVVINAQLANFTTAQVSFTLIVNPRTTSIVASNYIEIPWIDNSYNVTLKYIDSKTGLDIKEASGEYSIISELTRQKIYQGNITEKNGDYIIEIPVTLLGIGTYTISFEIGKPQYENRTFSFAFVVEQRKTYLTLNTTSITTYWGCSKAINITYYDSDLTPPTAIPHAKGTYKIVRFGETQPILSGNLTETDGNYILKIDTLNLTIGNYKVYITMFKNNYTSQMAIIELNIEEIPTFAYAQPSELDLYWNTTGKIVVYYSTSLGVSIPNFTVLITVQDVTNRTYINWNKIINTTMDSGHISINVSTMLLLEGHSYIIHLTLTKENYKMQQLDITLNVYSRSFDVFLSSNQIDLVWGDIGNTTLIVKDAVSREYVKDVTVKIKTPTALEDAVSYQAASQGGIIIIDSNNATSIIDDYIIVTLIKLHYNNLSTSIKVRVTPMTINAKIQAAKVYLMNPIIPSGTKYTITLLDSSRGNKPFENINASLVVKIGTKIIYNATLSPENEQPGVYKAYVPWPSIKSFEPGLTYTLTVSINELKINGRTINIDYVSLQGGLKDVYVDYIGGSSKIAGIGAIPNLIFYPILIFILVIGSIASYKLVSYILLPEELKEINRLIKMIEKEDYTYEALSREEEIKKFLEKELEHKEKP